MKKILYSIIGCSILATFSSCSDFLDSENLYQSTTDSYYATRAEVTNAVTGIYDALYVGNILLYSNHMDDLMITGDPEGNTAGLIGGFLPGKDDIHIELWKETYRGVFRANSLIENVSKNDYTTEFASESEKDKFINTALGEAYFLKGYFMLRAAQFFGGMPIIPTTTASKNVPRSSYTETYTAIAEDLLKAIELLPEVDINGISKDDYGHATVWAAKGLLARAFLMYTGYMTNIEGVETTTLPLSDGSELTSADVAAELEDIMANSGHELANDFRNLWPYSYVNKSFEKYDSKYDPENLPYPWAAEEGLSWVGQDGANSEVGTGNKEYMFVTRHGIGNNAFSSGGNAGNRFLNVAVRSQSLKGSNVVPFGRGYGLNTVHSQLYADWDNSDLRKVGSIEEFTEEEVNAQVLQCYNMTLYLNKKYVNIVHNSSLNSNIFGYIYGSSMAWGMLAAQDFCILRYADVLLMHSELTETVDGINQVRTRSKLEPISSYSLQAVKDERMHELAFEGIRYFDLVRWGDIAEPSKNYFTTPADVFTKGEPGTFSVNYRPEIKGLVAVPQSEIRLSNGVYEQNPGW